MELSKHYNDTDSQNPENKCLQHQRGTLGPTMLEEQHGPLCINSGDYTAWMETYLQNEPGQEVRDRRNHLSGKPAEEGASPQCFLPDAAPSPGSARLPAELG
jgi:hypothetical protein